MQLNERDNPADHFYAAHWVVRLTGGGLFLFLALSMHTIYSAVVFMMVVLPGLRLMNGNWQQVVAAIRLLRWFVIPIFLLHALFSHGQLLFPDWPLPFTREGVINALRLSLYLIAIFMAALLLFAVLKRSEWVRLLNLISGSGKVGVYLLILQSMRQQLGIELHRLRELWRLQGQWKQMHFLLLSAFMSAIRLSRREADAVWLRWPHFWHVDEALIWRAGPTVMLVLLELGISWGMIRDGIWH